MRQSACALITFVLCLMACSCGHYRDSLVPKRDTVLATTSASSGEARFAKPVVIDTRSPQEYAQGHMEGALLMPYDAIGGMIEEQVPDRSTPILLYCHSGGRAERARKTLAAMNYTKVENLGGMQSAAAKLGKKVVR